MPDMKILSEKTGYSSYYLNKVFLAHTNYTVGQFYSLLRLHSILDQYEYNKAISQNKINYSCIANETGYCDQAHLTREFKNFMGITPKKYWDKYYSNLYVCFVLFNTSNQNRTKINKNKGVYFTCVVK